MRWLHKQEIVSQLKLRHIVIDGFVWCKHHVIWSRSHEPLTKDYHLQFTNSKHPARLLRNFYTSITLYGDCI